MGLNDTGRSSRLLGYRAKSSSARTEVARPPVGPALPVGLRTAQSGTKVPRRA
jgi:hypothetical protein